VNRVASAELDGLGFLDLLARVRPEAIAIDLDGTLLNDAGEVSVASSTALSSALGAGIRVIPVTARSPRGLEEALAGTPTSAVAVTSLGAIVWDRSRHIAVHYYSLASDVAAEIVTKARSSVFCPSAAVEITSDLFADARFPVAAGSATTLHDLQVTDLEDCGALAKVLLCPADLEGLGEFADWLTDQFSDVASIIPRSGRWVEVLAHGVDKGSGLVAACKHYQVSPHRMVAIGDEATDIPMFEIVGVPIAMPLSSKDVHTSSVGTGINSEEFVAAVVAAVVTARHSE
jgi:hypothetical protein